MVSTNRVAAIVIIRIDDEFPLRRLAVLESCKVNAFNDDPEGDRVLRGPVRNAVDCRIVVKLKRASVTYLLLYSDETSR